MLEVYSKARLYFFTHGMGRSSSPRPPHWRKFRLSPVDTGIPSGWSHGAMDCRGLSIRQKRLFHNLGLGESLLRSFGSLVGGMQMDIWIYFWTWEKCGNPTFKTSVFSLASRMHLGSSPRLPRSWRIFPLPKLCVWAMEHDDPKKNLREEEVNTGASVLVLSWEWNYIYTSPRKYFDFKRMSLLFLCVELSAIHRPLADTLNTK